MNKHKVIHLLRGLADELTPFIEPQTPTDLPDRPYALMWWSVLKSIASLIEAQEGPISDKQGHYLRRQILGGMGSFQDFALDEKTRGDPAKEANRQLRNKLHLLHLEVSDA